jgi:hypothetical protein
VTGASFVTARKDFDDHPTPSGKLDARLRSAPAARIWGDDELERRAVGVFRSSRRSRRMRPSAFGMRSVRSTSTSRRRASSP